MAVENAPPDASAATSTAAATSPVAVPAPPSWPWRRGALILAGAAQLITISALTSADPMAVTWSALLLAIAPAPLAAAAFAPAPVNRLAAVAGVAVLIAGIASGILHTGCSSSRRSWCSPSARSSCGASNPEPGGCLR
jgi:hypothetical protein